MQEASEIKLPEAREQAIPPTQDHKTSEKGGTERPAARIDFRNKFEEDGGSSKCTKTMS